MPGTTTIRAFPIPLDADPFADGALAVRNLANALDKLVQSGTATLNIVTTGVTVTAAVTFATAYAVAPHVVVGIVNPASNAPQNFSWGAATVTTTGFTLLGVRTAGAAATMTLHWEAVGQ